MVRAERSFASLCREQGIKNAFLANLAENAVVFRPRPVNGPEWYSRSADSSSELVWDPVFADVSSAGDLGYTTGPWFFREKGASPSAYGEYVSVWKGSRGGEWKVAVDAGVVHPEPLGRETFGERVEYGPGARRARSDSVDANRERGLLRDASRRFFQVWGERGIEGAYEEFAADDVLVLRNGAFPVRGKKRVLEAIAGAPREATIEGMGGDLSATADLGYTYGVLSWEGAEAREERSASYLWVWRRRPDGSWRLALDLLAEEALPAGETGE